MHATGRDPGLELLSVMKQETSRNIGALKQSVVTLRTNIKDRAEVLASIGRNDALIAAMDYLTVRAQAVFLVPKSGRREALLTSIEADTGLSLRLVRPTRRSGAGAVPEVAATLPGGYRGAE